VGETTVHFQESVTLQPSARLQPRYPAHLGTLPLTDKAVALAQQMEVFVREYMPNSRSQWAAFTAEPRQRVDAFKATWAALAAPSTHSSHVLFYHVTATAGEYPSEEEEAQTLLGEPLPALAPLETAGVQEGAFILALVISSSEEAQPKRRRVASVSVEYARSLARSSPGELKTSSDVRRLLAEPLPYPVLVDESQEALLAAATGHFNVAVRESDRAMPELAGLLEFAFSCSHITGGTEEVWASLADGLTGCVWRTRAPLTAPLHLLTTATPGIRKSHSAPTTAHGRTMRSL